MSVHPKSVLVVAVVAMLTSLLGSAVLLGWVFSINGLTRISPEWKPMVPATAVCFLLSGLALLAGKEPRKTPFVLVQILAVALVILASGARILEIGLNLQLGVETFGQGWLIPPNSLGQMALPTAFCFLAFGTGALFCLFSDAKPFRIAARLLAGALLVAGLGVVTGHWLNLAYLFEGLYSASGLIWVSLPTGFGMALLGLGLLGLSQNTGQSSAPNTEEQKVQTRALQINRNITAFVIGTFVITSLMGLKFLEVSIGRQAALFMEQTIASQSAFIDLNLDNRVQRARVVSDAIMNTPGLPLLIAQPLNATALNRLKRVSEHFLSRGFTSIVFEHRGTRTVLAGNPLPDGVFGARFKGEEIASLLWDQAYFLRARVPIRAAGASSSEAYLVTEQTMPGMDSFFKEAHRWGETGTSPLCARRNAAEVECFPQRERAIPVSVPDHFRDAPLPATLALAGISGIGLTTDYRGRDVLAAYRPVGNTGLGLVLRMDAAEVYAPVRHQLLIGAPLVASLAAITLWLIRLRVQPLVHELARSFASEKAEHARFVAAMESSPDLFAIYEGIKNGSGEVSDFRLAYLNQPPARVSEIHADIPERRTFLKLFPEEEETLAKYREVLRTGKMLAEEFSAPVDPGHVRWYYRRVVAMPEGVAVTVSDITREKNLQRQVEESNLLRTAILESSAYSIISTDPKGTITSFNKAAERLLWYTAQELVGKSTPAIFHDSEEIKNRAIELSKELGIPVAPGFGVFATKTARNIVEEREWTYVRKDGSRLPVLLSVTGLRDVEDNLHGYLGIAHDISAQKRADEYIRHIALHDVLTGLPNRALLEDRIKIAIENQRRNQTPFVVIMMDIDRFKHVNDSMGHHVGDRLLKEFVARIKTCLRPTDTLARMGGDEFVLVLNDSDDSGALMVAERMMGAMSPPIDVGLQELHITSSMGISICPRDGMDANELVRCADVAMYWVKGNGRNGYKVFSSGMDQGATERLQLERALHRGLESGEFTVFYQPQIDLSSGAVIGVESLLRWRKADDQFVSPATFIPLAEDTGLIVPIGSWVLKKACSDVVRMREHLGLDLKVSVNISPRQFMNGDLVSLAQSTLRETGLDAAQLELEITEGVLMDDRSGVATTLRELTSMGVSIAVDDFGTGYSSLSYLKRFPISKIKIDQSFVRDITTDSGDAALTAAIIAMGHSLHIPVIAEGIETVEQMDFLVANRCDEGQGYFWGRPMSFEALMHWFSVNYSKRSVMPG